MKIQNDWSYEAIFYGVLFAFLAFGTFCGYLLFTWILS